MPRGYRNMYAEFVSVRRHILQVSATGEKDLLAKMAEHANGGFVDGFQGSDDTHALLFHEPYDPDSYGNVGPQEGGPFMYAGNPFGEGAQWKYDLARQLINQADAEAPEPVELLEIGTARDEDCPRCGFPETGYSLTTEVTGAGERNAYQRCGKACGWQKNLGWFKPEHNHLVATIVEINKEPAKES